MREGIFMASPTTTDSPIRSDDSRFIKLFRLSGAEAVIMAWSEVFVVLSAMMVPTCARIVSDISDGR